MLSVIIPTLNEEKYLPRLLQSIKEQNFNQEEIEIIVADADSQDKTREIARSFGYRVIKGGNLSQGRNNGAKAASNNLLLFADADIVLPKDFLQKAVKEFSERGLDGAAFLLYPINGEFWENFLFDVFYNYPIRLLFSFWKHGSMALLVKKGAHQKIEGFNEEIVFMEDLDYVRRLAKHRKYRLIKSVQVFVSTRRFQRNNWFLRTYFFQIVLGDIYTTLFGPIKKNIFYYNFGNHDTDN
jgi:glycosyltransferase involved in cell wall biosynthesis